jgi:hypothetical protein
MSSIKGLKRRHGAYYHRIEGWTCSYARYHSGGFSYTVDGSRGAQIGSGWAFSLTAARAAARAVVMERETRGLERVNAGHYRSKLALFVSRGRRWYWQTLEKQGYRWGTAPTLAGARKAAKEASK